MATPTWTLVREDIEAAIRRGTANTLTALVTERTIDEATSLAATEVMKMLALPEPDGIPVMELIAAVTTAAAEHPAGLVMLIHDSTGEYGLALQAEPGEALRHIGAGWVAAVEEG